MKQMQETTPSSVLPNRFYCRPTDDKAVPCHTHDSDRPFSCLLLLQHKQQTTCSVEVKQETTLRLRDFVRILWQAAALRRGMPNETPRTRKAQKGGRRKQGGKGNPDGGGSRVVRVTMVQDGAPQPPPP